MDVVNAVILGVVQGLTEFLPVSSSGHLVLGKYILGFQEQGIEFEVFVHFGTLLAVFTVFRRDMWNLLLGFFSIFTVNYRQRGFKNHYKQEVNFRTFLFVLIASIPAAIIGLLFKDSIESTFSNPRFACLMLIITALILFLTIFVKKLDKELSLRNTFIIGVAQAFAILPGISRSGSTICTGLYQGVNGMEAARFSFILAIPAILGATLLQSIEVIQSGIGGDVFVTLATGMIAAYVSGFFAIESLLAIVKRGKLYWFAPYCLLVGILGLIFI